MIQARLVVLVLLALPASGCFGCGGSKAAEPPPATPSATPPAGGQASAAPPPEPVCTIKSGPYDVPKPGAIDPPKREEPK